MRKRIQVEFDTDALVALPRFLVYPDTAGADLFAWARLLAGAVRTVAPLGFVVVLQEEGGRIIAKAARARQREKRIDGAA